MLDYLIENATVVTGRLEIPRKGRVGIQDGKIAWLATESDTQPSPEARHVVDGTGCLLTPGFIDPHASTGFGYFFPNAADHKLYQGITTEIFGNCGTSPAPIGPHLVSTMERLSNEIGFPFDWRTTSEYFERIADHLQFNIATLVGHSTLRHGAMEDWHDLSPEHLDTMRMELAQAMDEGALGISTGLIYAPGCFAEMEEIVALGKVVAEKGGVYASHIRNERDKVEEAVAEALEIGEKAGVCVLISHLKAAEQQNWGKIPKVLAQIDRFNSTRALQTAVDVYPYTAVSTKLRAFIPKDLLQDGIAALSEKMGDPANVARIEEHIKFKDYHLDQMLIISDAFPDYYNKTVEEIATELGIGQGAAMARMLAESTEIWVVYHCIDQADIDAAVMWPKAMICTDSWSYPINAPKTIGQPHPRSYGAFTEFLERYVVREQLLDWAEAIHKISYLPAEFFQLEGRGEIALGKNAAHVR